MTPRVRRYAAEEAARRSVPVEQVLGRCHLKHVNAARRSLMRRLSADGFTSTQIGRWLNRDHSTVIHALRKFA